MSSDDSQKGPSGHRASRSRRVLGFFVNLLGVALLLVGAVLAREWILSSEPVAQREARTRKSAALVETVRAERGTFRPRIDVLGAVRPAREIVLSPRVSGEIVEVKPSFRPGGIVRAGEPLLRIDAADYDQALVMRESELGQVQAELAIEEGQQRVAEREFELLGADIEAANRSLVLREPQISSLRNKLRAAEAAVRGAKLDLERTKIAAPFPAQILERHAELGSQVSAGDRLARLVGTEEYWVEATVPLGKVRWIRFPEADARGASARIHHRSVWEKGKFREGSVERLIGEVDASTRLARVLVSVPRPLGGDGDPALILGTVVRVEIEARPVENVVRLQREHLRQNQTVWVMQDGELRVREVDVVFSNRTHAFLRSGVEQGERVVTTNLATVVDGLPIREAAETATEDAESADDGGEK